MATEADLNVVVKALRNSSGWIHTGMLGSVLNSLPSYKGHPPIRVIRGKDEEMLNGIGINTACATSGPSIIFTEKFLSTLTKVGVAFVMLHECGHIAMKHHARRKGRHPELWNIACDYVINGMLMYHVLPAFMGLIKNDSMSRALSENSFKVEPTALFVTGERPVGLGMTPATETKMRQYYLEDKLTEEEVYYVEETNIRQSRKTEAQPKNDNPGQGGSGGGGGPGTSDGSGGGDGHYQGGYEMRQRLEEMYGDVGKELADSLDLPGSPESAQKNEEMEQRIASNAKIQNMGSSGIGKHINNYIDGSVSAAEGEAAVRWDIEVTGIMTQSMRGELFESDIDPDLISIMSRTEDLQNMMGLGRPVFIPDFIRRTGKGRLLVIMDTSGSVSDDEKRMFTREIKEMCKDISMDITIVPADTVGRKRIVIDTDENEIPDPLDVPGGGGTDMLTPLVEEVAIVDEPYDMAIVMSDGEFHPYSKDDVVSGLERLGKLEKSHHIPPLAFLITRPHYSSKQMKEAAETFGPRRCVVLQLDNDRQQDMSLSGGDFSV